MSEGTSFYKQIDGKQYSRRLLDLADQLQAGQGDGRISEADAHKVFAALENDGKYTDLEKDTIAFIRSSNDYNQTEAGDAALRGAVRVWAAIRGAK